MKTITPGYTEKLTHPVTYKVANQPLIVDETYPLHTFNATHTYGFIDDLRPEVTGVIGQYGDQTPADVTPYSPLINNNWGPVLRDSTSHTFSVGWYARAWPSTGNAGITQP